jgi:hypothetical protein
MLSLSDLPEGRLISYTSSGDGVARSSRSRMKSVAYFATVLININAGSAAQGMKM